MGFIECQRVLKPCESARLVACMTALLFQDALLTVCNCSLLALQVNRENEHAAV